MKIVFEDKDIIIINKAAGVAVQTAKIGQMDLEAEVKNYLSKKGEGSYLGVIHRLDQPVAGLVLFAKNEKAAALLSKNMAEGKFKKKYYALVENREKPETGEIGETVKLEDFLIKDGKAKVSRVASAKTPGAKKAVLNYRIVTEKAGETVMDLFPEFYKEYVEGKYRLLQIELMTGRFHQIRCQLSHAEMPIAGDVKYGSTVNYVRGKIALASYYLAFEINGKKYEYFA